ncbi:MAG: pyridoxamine 5'-phosphate oxidase family protein [Solirubrobacteraceae bacterium]
MSPAQEHAFLDEQRTIICATNGAGGWPHLMPLWYVLRGDELWAWTYGKSQKVRNLERDPRATLQVEAGLQYAELRGVMIEARTEIHREPGFVAELGAALLARYAGGSPVEINDEIRRQATKRVALQFLPERVASWDHRKLAGGY